VLALSRHRSTSPVSRDAISAVSVYSRASAGMPSPALHADNDY
jgi:hypothetical protein